MVGNLYYKRIPMESSSGGPRHADDGIIVVASLDLLRRGAKKVLFEYSEIVENEYREIVVDPSEICIGDTIIFREKMDIMPAEIVAIKIGEQQWLVISTTELPESGLPTTKDAMRVGTAEEKKLRIIKDFLAKEVGNYIIQDVVDWKPDKLADADKIKKIVRNATKRWIH